MKKIFQKIFSNPTHRSTSICSRSRSPPSPPHWPRARHRPSPRLWRSHFLHVAHRSRSCSAGWSDWSRGPPSSRSTGCSCSPDWQLLIQPEMLYCFKWIIKIKINIWLTLSFTPYQTFIFLEILFKIRNQHKILSKKVESW